MNDTLAALNRLCKFRTLLAGWQLGTRAKSDPEASAVRDHRELSLLLRAEVSALTGLLLAKGVITGAEFDAALGEEAERLAGDMARRFPGVTARDDGLGLDPGKIGWMAGWRP